MSHQIEELKVKLEHSVEKNNDALSQIELCKSDALRNNERSSETIENLQKQLQEAQQLLQTRTMEAEEKKMEFETKMVNKYNKCELI